MLRKTALIIRVICVSPFRIFNLILVNTTNMSRGQMDEESIRRISFLCLQAAMFQSLPQTGLQCYAILADAVEMKQVDLVIALWQWATVLTSIFSLAFNISTNNYLFEMVPGKTKCAFFFICAINVYARLWVFVMYAGDVIGGLSSPLLGLIPVFTLLLASISIWVIKRMCRPCCCTFVLPLAGDVHHVHHHDYWTTVLMTWLITAAFNGFTGTGLLIAGINMALASPWILLAYESLMSGSILVGAVVTVIPSFLSVIMNILIIGLPSWRHITKHWLNFNAKEETLMY